MQQPIKYFILALVSLLLVGCASSIRTQVNSFNQWPTKLHRATFKFETDASSDDYLEQRYYQDEVAKNLQMHGLKWQQNDHAQLRIKTKLSVTQSDETASSPIFQEDSYYVAPYVYYENDTRKEVPGHWVSAGYKWVGNELRNYKLYHYEFKLGVYHNEDKIFESTAITSSSNYSKINFAHFLIKSMFANFPGTNGQVKNYKLNAKTGEFK